MSDVLVTKTGAVGLITMNRPERHNAFNERMIARLIEALDDVATDPAIRVVKLAGAGKSFSAGADLDWMRRMADYSHEENLADARELGRMLRLLHALPKPTIAVVQGSAFGGGVGLVAAADFAIAAPEAAFSLSEVALGLIPSVISPYVVRAVGPRAAKALALSAARFDAAEALRLGLIDTVVPASELDQTADALAERLVRNSPQAMAAAKELMDFVSTRPIDAETVEGTVERIARQRASAEGRDGVAAFLEKRLPRWRKS